MNKIKKILKNPKYIFIALSYMGFFKNMDDEKYLKTVYKIRTGKNLNIDNPVTFNEKLQWLKLHDRKPEYTTMVDKYAVKKYVSDKIGEKYIIPTIGVWDRFEEIDFSSLPNQFVLKCTHDSGGLVICTDKSKFNIELSRKKINRCLKRNFYYEGREWPYKDVPPRIIAEKYMEDSTTKELRDYKFFCFQGKAKLLFVGSDRQNPNEEVKFDFYDMHFNHLNIRNGHPLAKKRIEKPQHFDEMVVLAEQLSKNIPFLRVDFYEVDGAVYFGELTFYQHSGFVLFEPLEYEKKLGSWIKLPT